eukprot:scaffold6446_cov104-Isochrysis_galbana.AAC.25
MRRARRRAGEASEAVGGGRCAPSGSWSTPSRPRAVAWRWSCPTQTADPVVHRALDRLAHDAHHARDDAEPKLSRAVHQLPSALFGRRHRTPLHVGRALVVVRLSPVAARPPHVHRRKRAVRRSRRARDELAERVDGGAESLLCETGAAGRDGPAKGGRLVHHGEGRQVEEVLDAGAPRADEADRVAQHVHLQQHAHQLPEQRELVVVGDGGAKLGGRPHQVFPQ